jgi:hypothetical protein
MPAIEIEHSQALPNNLYPSFSSHSNFQLADLRIKSAVGLFSLAGSFSADDPYDYELLKPSSNNECKNSVANAS